MTHITLMGTNVRGLGTVGNRDGGSVEARVRAAWTLPRGQRALEEGRVESVKGRPEPAAKLGLAEERM